MKAIVEALLENSLYAAIVAGAVLLFREAFRKSISPRLQYLAWMLLILRLLLPVTIESGFHVQSLFPQPPAETAASQVYPGVASGISIPAGAMLDSPEQALGPAASQAEAPPAQPQKQVDWYAVGFTAWLGGMATFGLWMAFVKLRFYRRMLALRLDTPPELANLYEACQREMGAQSAMKLWVMDAAMSPGIALFGGPVLLMPRSLSSSPEALRFALLHELTHQKRGDHYLCSLMNLLRMAYWFNPVVHYAFSQMQADMETACDCDVLRHLSAAEKRGYLTTVLSLFSFEGQPQLGMARSRIRRMAERRMKGAFMKNTASTASKLAAAGLTLVLLTACFTTACQQAPAAGTATLEKKATLPSETPLQTPAIPAEPSSIVTPTPALSPMGVLPTPTPALIPGEEAFAASAPAAVEAGSEVKAIQEKLLTLGYTVHPSGIYDEETIAAVKAFQSRNGIKVDGYVGQEMRSRLYSADSVENGPQGSSEEAAYSAADISKMLDYAKKAIGKAYALGESGPENFDPSGLVYYCLKRAGSNRPRLSALTYSEVEDWEKITDMDSLQPGDLVFFYNNKGDQVGHIGIVSGSDTMIDASSANGRVVERSYKTSYWIKHFEGGRRPW